MTRVRRNRPEEPPTRKTQTPQRAWDMPRERQPQFSVEEVEARVSGKLRCKVDAKNNYRWYVVGSLGVAFVKGELRADHTMRWYVFLNGHIGEAAQVFDDLAGVHAHLIEELAK